MTKLSIEIEDVTDKRACERALRQFFQVIEEYHGEETTKDLAAMVFKLEMEKHVAKFLRDPPCGGIPASTDRLVLEYYSMPKPNKQKLARELAKRNETLPQVARYGARGTTDPMTMLTQIKRLLKHEGCQKIANATPAQREEALRRAERICEWLAAEQQWRRTKKTLPKPSRR